METARIALLSFCKEQFLGCLSNITMPMFGNHPPKVARICDAPKGVDVPTGRARGPVHFSHD